MSSVIPPPTHLLDRHGTPYRLDFEAPDFGCDGCWTFLLYLDGARLPAKVGYAYCWGYGPDELRINDFRIDKDVHFPPTGLKRLLNRLLPTYFPWPRRGFRRLGLGSALLLTVITTARQNGFTRIGGQIVAMDLAEFPGLAAWYECYGFIVAKGPQFPRTLSLTIG